MIGGWQMKNKEKLRSPHNSPTLNEVVLFCFVLFSVAFLTLQKLDELGLSCETRLFEWYLDIFDRTKNDTYFVYV